ncbi:hypothetical protein HPB48_004544 [Haemaphysalis longicornis]|uniref:Uncharacterized protein n=1 Tax=Haemaphysalis longicornis TaxID=44386 RepID=A0A9J6G133_HAELO|nr:hypothetical protein HPB48_004544 [Haemaphysalis longicornis]
MDGWMEIVYIYMCVCLSLPLSQQIKFQLDLPTRGDLMGGESGGGGLIAPENIKRELPDELPPSGPRSLGSMQKVPSLSDLSEESSLGEWGGK